MRRRCRCSGSGGRAAQIARGLNLDGMTPLQAFEVLREWKGKWASR